MAAEEQRPDKSLALTDERHGGLQRAWESPATFKVAAGFLLVVVAIGIWVAISGKPSTATTAHTPAASTPPQQQIITSASTPAIPAGSSSTSCTLPAGSQSVPYNSPPSGTSWATVGAMQVPQAPRTFGPQDTSGVWNTCFAHNPAGALLAAINVWGETSTTASASEVFQRVAVGAPRNVGNNESLDTAAGGPVQFAGYKYDSYTPAEAELSVVLQEPQGKLVAVVMSMTWNGRDWKLVYPPNGVPPLEVIPNLTGYVQWSDF